MKKTQVLLCVLVSVCLSSCSPKELRVKEFQVSEYIPNAAKPPTEFYVIGPGDLLGINIWKETSLSGPVKVRPDGFITLPLVNEVQVTGLTTTELRLLLEKRYKEFLINPIVTIRVTGIQSSQIYLIGKVNKPGVLPLTGNDTLLQVLTKAGGLTIFARRSDIRVVRRNGEKVTEYIVDYNAIIKGDLKQDILLRPGDRIIVP